MTGEGADNWLISVLPVVHFGCFFSTICSPLPFFCSSMVQSIHLAPKAHYRNNCPTPFRVLLRSMMPFIGLLTIIAIFYSGVYSI